MVNDGAPLMMVNDGAPLTMVNDGDKRDGSSSVASLILIMS